MKQTIPKNTARLVAYNIITDQVFEYPTTDFGRQCVLYASARGFGNTKHSEGNIEFPSHHGNHLSLAGLVKVWLDYPHHLPFPSSCGLDRTRRRPAVEAWDWTGTEWECGLKWLRQTT